MNAKWRCCLIEIGAETRDIAVTSVLFMICPKLKSSTFAKMAEMFDGCMGS
jgi:hypothetical protein